MEFKLTKSQIEIQKAARDFAKSEFDKELASEMDKYSVFPRKIYQKAAELGFTSIHFEEEYLGGGLGFLESVLMAEELSRKDSTLGSAVMLSSYGADILSDFASKELKSCFLADLAEGKRLSGAAIVGSELDGQLKDSHLKARQENNSWVINGSVKSVVNGNLSGFFIVLCETDQAAPSQKSHSVILIEKNREGVELLDTGPKLGLRMTAVADL
ncbi:acyl-CoA/acyl-ACP dehydrogenase, partial [bacterium]|nr:acyl-CoA/acyl-ACP dehydrogenase [bacterium]